MFGLEPYHILLVAVGIAIVLSYWVPRFLSGREPAASALLVLAGALVFMLPGMPASPDPVARPQLWERAAELCVIIGLSAPGSGSTGWRRVHSGRPPGGYC